MGKVIQWYDDGNSSSDEYSSVINGIHAEINYESAYLKGSLWNKPRERSIIDDSISTSLLDKINTLNQSVWNTPEVRTIIDALAKYEKLAGLSLACSTVYTWWSFKSTSFALNKIRRANSVQISDLRLLLTKEEENLVVLVRGLVKPESEIIGMIGFKNTIESEVSGKLFKSVMSEKRSKPYINSDGLTWSTKLLLQRAPFVVADGKNKVNVDFDLHAYPPSHHVPYVTIFRERWFNSLNPFFDGVVEEKILPVGKEINAIGVVYCKDGKIPHIKPCDDLPYFLSDLTKDQMVQQLVNKRGILFVGGIVLGSLFVCVLTFFLRRYWRRWKQPRGFSN